jgi:endonuclease-8
MEGPSLIILKEEVSKFKGKKILEVYGNSKTIDIYKLINKKVISFQSWGKHFLIDFKGFYLKIHFLMFGSYTIDKEKPRTSRLTLCFKNGKLHLYTCSVKLIEGKPEDSYEWSSDLMSDKWNLNLAVKKMKLLPEHFICDVLLDQNIFSGSGNIIKNEVLYRLQFHPLRKIKTFTTLQLKKIANETRVYSFDFYKWKKVFQLRKHWLAYKKKLCLRCKLPFTQKATGKMKRKSYYCENCQR